MRTIKQVAVEGNLVYALCEDGSLWACERHYDTVSTDPGDPTRPALVYTGWEFIEGPPEGRPDYKPPTLEEQAEHLRQDGANQLIVGRGHHLSKGEE